MPLEQQLGIQSMNKKIAAELQAQEAAQAEKFQRLTLEMEERARKEDDAKFQRLTLEMEERARKEDEAKAKKSASHKR
jgi:hypothetical protein